MKAGWWCRIGMHRWGVRVAAGRLIAGCTECGKPDEILQAALDERQGPS